MAAGRDSERVLPASADAAATGNGVNGWVGDGVSILADGV